MFFLVPFFLFLKCSFLFRSFCLFCAVNSERFRSCFVKDLKYDPMKITWNDSIKKAMEVMLTIGQLNCNNNKSSIECREGGMLVYGRVIWVVLKLKF